MEVDVPEPRRDNLVSDLIRVIAACDAGCPFCNWPHEEHRDFAQPTVEQLVAAAGARANPSGAELVLSGGEPLLRDDLEDVVAALKRAGVGAVRIQTNALWLTSARAASLAAAGLDRALISLHSRDPAIHDRMMGQAGAHAAALRGARALQVEGVALSFNHVLTALNADGLVEDVRWLAETFPDISHLSLSAVQPHGRARGRADIVPRYPAIAGIVRAALAEADRLGLGVNNPYCGLPLCIGWEDRLDRCVEAAEAEAAEQGERPAPLGLSNRGDKQHLPVCRRCADRASCGGVWREYLKIHGAEGIAPVRAIDDEPAPAGAALGDVERGQRNLEVNLGKACNNRCVFCANGEITASERRWTPVDQVEAETRRGRDEGCTSLGFLGGEPTLYPWLERVVRHARAIGYRRVALCTNGTRLHLGDLAARLVDAGVTRLAISVHSHRRAEEDRLTGRAGSFDAKLAGLDAALRLRDAGRLADNVALEAVLTRASLRRLVPYVEFFAARGVVDFRFNVIRPEGASARDRRVVPRMREAADAITELIAVNEQRLGLRLLFGDLPLCVLPAPLLVNRPLLRRYIGEQLDMDTRVAVLRPDTGEVERFGWTERKRERLKLRLPACECCALDGTLCEGVWRQYVDLYGDEEFQPVPG